MERNNKIVKTCPTELTWEEKNSDSYLFNNDILTQLKEAIKKAEDVKTDINGKHTTGQT